MKLEERLRESAKQFMAELEAALVEHKEFLAARDERIFGAGLCADTPTKKLTRAGLQKGMVERHKIFTTLNAKPNHEHLSDSQITDIPAGEQKHSNDGPECGKSCHPGLQRHQGSLPASAHVRRNGSLMSKEEIFLGFVERLTREDRKSVV